MPFAELANVPRRAPNIRRDRRTRPLAPRDHRPRRRARRDAVVANRAHARSPGTPPRASSRTARTEQSPNTPTSAPRRAVTHRARRGDRHAPSAPHRAIIGYADERAAVVTYVRDHRARRRARRAAVVAHQAHAPSPSRRRARNTRSGSLPPPTVAVDARPLHARLPQRHAS